MHRRERPKRIELGGQDAIPGPAAFGASRPFPCVTRKVA
jgi:hypothetical protein